MAEAKTKTEAKKKINLEEYYNERVPITVRRPPDIKDESVTVTLNGKNYQIMYDTEVMVPRSVANILEESERNMRIANEKAREAMKATMLAEF